MLLALTVVGTSCDNDDNIVMNDNVRTYINARYPDAVILETDNGHGYQEVEIYHELLKKEVYFKNDDTWIKTKWEVVATSLPEVVIASITAEYPGYHIDDVICEETPDGVYYSIEIEKGNREVYINVAPDGTIEK